MADGHEDKGRFADGDEEHRVPLVGIGASAGGLEALREMLGAVSEPTGLAFVIIQHLDPDHESMLAQLLARETPLRVAQAEGGERPQADHVYIIPPGVGLAMERGRLQLTPFSRPRGMRRPIDDFFETLADDHEHWSACVILSGTGADGSVGLRAIKERGGIALVQEPTSARYDGMPLSAVGTGLVDFVREPAEIILCLQDYFARRLGNDYRDEEASHVALHIDELCQTLRDAVGHDFSGYKRSTLERRIARRMQVLGIDGGEEYLRRLRSDADECEALFRDLLINVTRFFRDIELFDVLNARAIEPIVQRLARRPGEAGEIRVWVPGCSSGEEAYTIAMLIAEACEREGIRPLVQLFATDIDETMLGIARDARYSPAALADMPERLREKYMHLAGDQLVVSAMIRDMVRFSNHSIIKDPPFSRLDLVSCRNLLIYFADRLQQLVVPLLHYALNEDGFLFLGPSETIGRFDDLFDPIDSKARLFRRLPGRAQYPTELHLTGRRGSIAATRGQRLGARGGAPDDLAIKRLVERYAPASMVLDENGEVHASYGRLSRYFEFPSAQQGGRVVASALARPGLREILMPMLGQVRTNRTRIIARDVNVMSEFGRQRLNVIADPLPDGKTLVIFRETEAFAPAVDDDLVEMGPLDGQVQVLEDELRATRHRLRVTVEELETVNEELKSSNEEMMSMNEELQSTNEELTTVNDELKTKVDQLTQANTDLSNFFDSTQLAVIVLDEAMAVRSFTDAATRIFPLKVTDRGRPLAEVTTLLDEEQYLVDARAVAAGNPVIERHATSRDGRIYRLRVMPYRVFDGSVRGATLVFTDISDEASLEAQLAAERERLGLALRVAGIGVWEYFVDRDTVVTDRQVEHLFGLARGAEHPLDEFVDRIHPDDRHRVQSKLRRAISGEADYDTTFRTIAPDGTMRTLRGLGRLIVASSPPRLVGCNYDITAEEEAAQTRELMLREMNHRVKNLFAIVGGMVTLAARTTKDSSLLASTIRERISALGRAHSLTGPRADGDTTDLGALIEAALEPYADHGGLALDGPAVTLTHKAVSSLALLFHEFATNSVKYGALGQDGGTLTVRWECDADDNILIHWTERLVHPRNVPGAEGFGTTLLAASAQQLGATLDQRKDEEGFHVLLRLPTACRAG